jgi:hypothetical protein
MIRHLLERGGLHRLPNGWRNILVVLYTLGIRSLSPFFRPHPNPLIVLGNQKSGTTAISGLLARLTGLPFAFDDLGRLLPDYEKALLTGTVPLETYMARNQRFFSRPIYKEPTFTFLFQDLRRAIPGARFLFVIRDPRDNIRSILNRLGLPGDLNALPGELRSRMRRNWRHVLDPGLNDTRETHPVGVLAARWRRAAEVHLRHHDEMKLVRYEDFCARKLETLKEVSAAFGLPVDTPNGEWLDEQYQPRGKDRGGLWIDFFGPENLERIDRVCGPTLTEFGYSITTP